MWNSTMSLIIGIMAPILVNVIREVNAELHHKSADLIKTFKITQLHHLIKAESLHESTDSAKATNTWMRRPRKQAEFTHKASDFTRAAAIGRKSTDATGNSALSLRIGIRTPILGGVSRAVKA